MPNVGTIILILILIGMVSIMANGGRKPSYKARTGQRTKGQRFKGKGKGRTMPTNEPMGGPATKRLPSTKRRPEKKQALTSVGNSYVGSPSLEHLQNQGFSYIRFYLNGAQNSARLIRHKQIIDVTTDLGATGTKLWGLMESALYFYVSQVGVDKFDSDFRDSWVKLIWKWVEILVNWRMMDFQKNKNPSLTRHDATPGCTFLPDTWTGYKLHLTSSGYRVPAISIVIADYVTLTYQLEGAIFNEGRPALYYMPCSPWYGKADLDTALQYVAGLENGFVYAQRNGLAAVPLTFNVLEAPPPISIISTHAMVHASRAVASDTQAGPATTRAVGAMTAASYLTYYQRYGVGESWDAAILWNELNQDATDLAIWDLTADNGVDKISFEYCLEGDTAWTELGDTPTTGGHAVMWMQSVASRLASTWMIQYGTPERVMNIDSPLTLVQWRQRCVAFLARHMNGRPLEVLSNPTLEDGITQGPRRSPSVVSPSAPATSTIADKAASAAEISGKHTDVNEATGEVYQQAAGGKVIIE